MSENWVTVSSKSIKKPSQVQKKQNGSASVGKPTYSDAPKAPVFGEKSQFDALTVVNKKSRPPTPKADGDVAKPKSSIPRPSKKDGAKKSGAKHTLEAVAPTLSGQQFEELYQKNRELFPDNPLTWLKDLTGNLNLKLDQLGQANPVFSGQPEDYPSCLIKPEVKKVLNKSIRDCSFDMLQVFVEQLIQSITTDMSKGFSVYGSQIVAQILLKYKPQLSALQTKKFQELVIANKNFPAKCQTIMWVLGQGGVHNLDVGLKVWSAVMLPVIEVKALAPYAVEYLTKLLKKHADGVDKVGSVIDMQQYFLVFDATFADNFSLHASLRKVMRAHYPTLKKLTVGKMSGNAFQKSFPSFLARLKSTSAQTDIQKELLEDAALTLVSEPQCFHVWQKVYPEYVVQSSVLLNHLADNWQENCSRGLDYKLVKETVDSFKEKNRSYSNKTVGLEASTSACLRFDEVQIPAARSSMSLSQSILIVIFLAVLSLVAFDVHQNGGFKGSTSRKLLKDSGIDVIIANLFSNLSSTFTIIKKFLIKNVPIWIETTVVYVEPALDFIWNYAVAGVKYLLAVSKPLRMWLAENVPYFIDWLIMHPVWTILYNYLVDIWSLIEPYLQTVQEKVQQMF